MNEMNDHSNPATPLISDNKCEVCYGEKEISDLANGGCKRCPHCNGSGIQPEAISKSESRRLAVQKPETEEEKIREKEAEKHFWNKCDELEPTVNPISDIKEWYILGFMETKDSFYINRIGDHLTHIEELKDKLNWMNGSNEQYKAELFEKDKQIESMRNHDNCHHYPYDYKKEVCAKCGSVRYMDNWKQKESK